MRLLVTLALLLTIFPAGCHSRAETPSRKHRSSYLAADIILIVRHAEKPTDGTTGLTPAGEARAASYATFFEPFQIAGYSFRVDALYASTDSPHSQRPRLTLEPLSAASGLPIDASINNKDAADLVALLQTTPHGKHPLIAWHHGQVPTLLKAFGAKPDALLPDGVWPADVFNWVLLLRFDDHGDLVESRRLTQP